MDGRLGTAEDPPDVAPGMFMQQAGQLTVGRAQLSQAPVQVPLGVDHPLTTRLAQRGGGAQRQIRRLPPP